MSNVNSYANQHDDHCRDRPRSRKLLALDLFSASYVAGALPHGFRLRRLFVPSIRTKCLRRAVGSPDLSKSCMPKGNVKRCYHPPTVYVYYGPIEARGVNDAVRSVGSFTARSPIEPTHRSMAIANVAAAPVRHYLLPAHLV